MLMYLKEKSRIVMCTARAVHLPPFSILPVISFFLNDFHSVVSRLFNINTLQLLFIYKSFEK